MGNYLMTCRNKNNLIDNKIHLINFNSNSISNSIHNANIFINFVNTYKNKNVILCGQGFRDFDKSLICDDNNYYFDENLGLVIYTNLDKYNFISTKFKNQGSFDTRVYGYFKNKITYKKYNFIVYNTEIISNYQNNYLCLCYVNLL